MMKRKQEIVEEKEVEQKKGNNNNNNNNKYGGGGGGDGVSWFRGAMIGKGSFGCVFLATLKKPKSKFRCFPSIMAVKSAEVSASASIQKEKEALSNVGRCNHLIRCFGEETTIGENGEMVYNLLLEFGSGGTLAGLLYKFPATRLPESDVRRYTKDILVGIRHIHEQGYVHCDLKPENVLLVKDSRRRGGFRAKIGDLGLAKRCKQSNKKRKLEAYWRGTPMYLAPEAVVESVQEFPCDIWALGCIVLEMLTGKAPWEGGRDFDADELLCRIGKGRELPKIPDEVSVDAKNFLKGCFVWKPMFRLNADMLMCHPFVEGLGDEEEEDGDEEEEEEEEEDDISDVNMDSSLLLLSDADDYDEFNRSYFSDDCSFVSDEEDCVSYLMSEEEEEISSEKITANGRTLEIQGSREDSINSEFNQVIKKSKQVPSNAREQYPIAFTIPAGV